MSTGGFSKVRLRRLHDAMAGYVERDEVPGIVTLVSRRGEVHADAVGVLAIGGRPVRRDTIFRIASLTKPVAAVAAMILVEECRLRLDEPTDRLLPELAGRRVLKRLDGPLDDTVPAKRPVTLRDLLTLRFGIGYSPEVAGGWPIQQAFARQNILQGPPRPQAVPGPDEWIRRVGTLPLMYQPGERWLYELGIDVLGVLIARVTGQPLETVLQERLFAPLGMRDTGFQVPAAKLDRFASAYMMDPQAKKLGFFDDAANSRWSKPPPFAAGGSGLVSTVDDFHVFYRMLISRGLHGYGPQKGERILARPTVELMMSDQLTSEQKQGAELFFGHGASWGMGGAVVTRRTDIFATPGRFGWDGGYGTSAHLDPAEDMIGILMTQRMMDSPVAPRVFRDFWTSAYQAFDD